MLSESSRLPKARWPNREPLWTSTISMTTKISCVQIHEFRYEVEGIGFDAGGFDLVYVPGHRQPITKAAIVVETADGARGEYVALWGATPMALAQTIMLA